MSNDNEFFYKQLSEKLENPEIDKKLASYKKKIEKLLDCNVDFTFLSDSDKEKMDKFEAELEFAIDSETSVVDTGNEYVTLDKLKEILKLEDGDKNVYIDPLHLKKGMFPIKELMIVGMDNYVILIPRNIE